MSSSNNDNYNDDDSEYNNRFIGTNNYAFLNYTNFHCRSTNFTNNNSVIINNDYICKWWMFYQRKPLTRK